MQPPWRDYKRSHMVARGERRKEGADRPLGSVAPFWSLHATAFRVAVPCWALATSMWVSCLDLIGGWPSPLFFVLICFYTLFECTLD
jgi:hypothetical protein